MFASRFLLHQNWLKGKCNVRTFEGHTQGNINNLRIIIKFSLIVSEIFRQQMTEEVSWKSVIFWYE